MGRRRLIEPNRTGPNRADPPMSSSAFVLSYYSTARRVSAVTRVAGFRKLEAKRLGSVIHCLHVDLVALGKALLMYVVVVVDVVWCSCRYGANCKYYHPPPQQQRNQQQYRPQQQKNEPERRDNYYSALSNNGTFSNRSQQHNQSPPPKEHRCNDPRECKEQIKEDFAKERPSFWRLTCYAHYKSLPNDIVGDVSPEELRALAYEGAKQGLSVKDIVQREASMVAAKNAEFDALLRNPYKGPATQNTTNLQTGSFAASPFLNPQRNNNFMSFGSTANGSGGSPAQVFPQPSVGAVSPASFSFGTPSGNALFTTPQSNTMPPGQQTNFFQQSPFQGNAGPSPGIQSPLQGNTGPSPGIQSPFQGSTGPSPGIQSPFQGNTGPSHGKQSSFQGSAGIVSRFQGVSGPSPGMQSPFLIPQGSSAALSGSTTMLNPPITPPQNFGTPSSFAPPGVAAPAGSVLGSQMLPTITLQEAAGTKIEQGTVQQNNADASIWSKEVWKIGEIPEVEPPPEVRF